MSNFTDLRGPVLVIEDEPLLAKALINSIDNLCHQAVVEPPVASVREMKIRAASSPPPALIFADIQLSDGLSLEALDLFPVSTAVIFTTAFDQYALRVFRYNALDYLLKPVSNAELAQAITKYLALLDSSEHQTAIHYAGLTRDMAPHSTPELKRLMLKKGKLVVPLPVSQVGVIFLEETVVWVYDLQGQHYISDFRSLDEIEIALNKQAWFRANRQTLVAKSAIFGFEHEENGKLLLHTGMKLKQQVSISKDKSASFKRWLINEH